jgi:hypothetical protein
MIFLNSKACIEPAIAKLSLGEAGFSIWWEKYSPNYFRHQCGVDPGEGYLLMQGSNVPSSSFSVPLTFGNVTIPKVTVIKSVELEASSESPTSSGIRLVQIQDIRCYLKRTQVKKNYNCVHHTDAEGTFIFDQSTMKHLGGSSYQNWTWETLINDLWDGSLLSSETLNLGDVTFPELIPTNYYFETWSHRDALAKVLLDLGYTLEPSTNGSWRVIGANSVTNIDNFVTNNSNYLIQSNNFVTGNGGHLPAKLICHFLFPEESPAGKEKRTYQYEHTVSPPSGQSVISGSHDSILCPIQAGFDFTNPTEPTNKIDLDAFAAAVAARLVKLLYTDDNTDATFGGFRDTFPSADIGRVTWKDTGSNISGDGTGATTRVEHFFPVPKIPKLDRPTVPLQKVSGSPVSNVSPEMATFELQNLKLISGVKPQEPLTVNNTYGQSYSTSERVEAEYTYEDREWNVPQKGTSSTTSSELIRFELAEEKTLEGIAAAAFRINPNNNAALAEIRVLDPLEIRFVGFGPRIDPQFGEQYGYRGWAQYAYTTEEDEDEPLTNYYHIITMEGPARWISGATYEEIGPEKEEFDCEVFNHWGASPNNRPPGMRLTEGTNGEEVPVTTVYDDNKLIQKNYVAGARYVAVYDEVRNYYILVSVSNELPKDDHYGLLTVDCPKADWTLAECTFGYADAAVKLFHKSRDDEESPHKIIAKGETYPIVNPIWPEIIKAGTTDDEDKPVVVVGYLDKWAFGDGIVQTVFVLKNVIYPITIVKGTTSSSVSGAGNITVGNLEVLWGRDPKSTTISVANPEGWEGPNPSVVIAMQIVDGTWLALYVTCP